MEIDGHPTQDLVEELERRGAIRIIGTTAGPDPDGLKFIAEGLESAGFWMFLPQQTFMTGFDDMPSG